MDMGSASILYVIIFLLVSLRRQEEMLKKGLFYIDYIRAWSNA